uniref:RxLR effector candidate protein n=1 Tax=Hyaloperonospora arabidopsidis (strain Emoy2) TaxID=559515 RepID=M4BMX3_HYAAE|nr:RxLR effector candidate protein [Hyaloperonospora arabidopsidis Emoy2]
MQVFYLVLVASSAVCAESTASSSTAAHDYQVAVRSFAGDQDSTPPTSLMPSDGTLDDEVRATTYIDRFVSKLAVVWSKLLGKNRNTLFLKLTDGLERSPDGIIKMLEDPKMKLTMASYSPHALVEKILVSFDCVDLALALVQVQRSSNEGIAKIATTLLQAQFRSWMGHDEKVFGTAFQRLKLDSIKSDEYRDFCWKVIVLDNFITAWKNWKDNKNEPIRAVNSKPVNKKEVVNALTEGFGGVGGFVSVIGGARRFGGQALEMGNQLSRDMQDVWKGIDKIPPKAVVVLMRRAGDPEALSDDNMQMLSAYIAHYLQIQHTTPPLLLQALIDGFGGGRPLAIALSKMSLTDEVIKDWRILRLLIDRKTKNADAPETSSVHVQKEQARKMQNRLWRSSLRIG